MPLSYETLSTLIGALTAFTVNLSFEDIQTDKSKDQAPKQHQYLGRKNNLAGYHRPIFFSRIGPERYFYLLFTSLSHSH